MSSIMRMLLGAALLTSGCVTLAPQPGGSYSEGPRALTTLRETAASTPPLEAPSSLASTEPGERERLHRRRSARGLGPDAALASTGEAPAHEVASAGTGTQGPPSCGGVVVPPGWPDFSSGDREALLAPFLTCTSPAEFLALQERVDMPRLVEALDDWRAVRLGVQGTPREDAARILNSKRTSFLVDATERYGAARAQVLSLYIVNSAHDDDLREIVFLLAQDKRLEEMLGLLPAFQTALEKRGLKPKARPDRDFEMRDLGRGLARAGRDALSSSPLPLLSGISEVHYLAELLVALMHTKVPSVFEATPESLTDVDYQFWHEEFPRVFERENIDAHAVPAIGAYLGQVLVRNLGGQWIPRQKLEEVQVRVGNRVWLPFVRAWRYMRSCQSLLDFSLTQLYRVAERHRS
jgi:hypothetical protein